MQSRRRIDNYYAAVGDDGFGGQAFGGAVELQRLMPRDALPVFRLAGPARKTSLFKRALLGPRNSDDDKECGTFPPMVVQKMAGSSEIIGSFSWLKARPPPPVHFSRFRTLFLDDSHLLPQRLHACWRGMLFFSE